MKYFRIIILSMLSLFIILFSGCSSSTPEVREVTKISEGIYNDGLRINVKQIYAWLNLMPGAKARFHITGSIELLESPEYNLENVTIKKINIVQNKNTIYQFSPKIDVTFEQNKKSFIFSTVQGLLLTSILNREKRIDVELLISDSSKEIIYLIPNVKISEVH